MGARTERFVGRRDVPGNGTTVLYTAPAAKRALVKELFLQNTSAAARTAYVFVRVAGVDHLVLLEALAANARHLDRDRHIVVNAGESLVVYWDGAVGATTHVVASGVLLVA